MEKPAINTHNREGTGTAGSVCFVITGLDYGGAEVQLTQLALGFVRRNWSVTVASMTRPVAFADELLQAGVQVVSLNMAKGVPDPRALFRLARLLRRLKPDLVHAHMYHANILCRITSALFRLRLPIICTVHSVFEGTDNAAHNQTNIRYRIYRWTERWSRLTTFVSGAAMQRYLREKAVSADRAQVIFNGVDVQRFSLPPEAPQGRPSPFIWLAVGRLTPPKDYANLLDAFRLLMVSHPDATLQIAGDGPLFGQMQEYSRQLQLDSNLSWLGLQSDIPTLMGQSHAYVMSSRWEGLPMVLLEAAAAKLPVVATNVGGNSEVVVSGHNGYLVSPEDPRALADAMSRVMELTPADRATFGQQGRYHVLKTFSMDQVLDQWQRLYQNECAK